MHHRPWADLRCPGSPVTRGVEKRSSPAVGARRSIARTGGALCNVNVVGKANSAEKENCRGQQNEPRRVAHAQSIAGYLPSLVAVRHGEENVATRPHLSQLVMGTAEVQDACLYSTYHSFRQVRPISEAGNSSSRPELGWNSGRKLS